MSGNDKKDLSNAFPTGKTQPKRTDRQIAEENQMPRATKGATGLPSPQFDKKKLLPQTKNPPSR